MYTSCTSTSVPSVCTTSTRPGYWRCTHRAHPHLFRLSVQLLLGQATEDVHIVHIHICSDCLYNFYSARLLKMYTYSTSISVPTVCTTSNRPGYWIVHILHIHICFDCLYSFYSAKLLGMYTYYTSTSVPTVCTTSTRTGYWRCTHITHPHLFRLSVQLLLGQATEYVHILHIHICSDCLYNFYSTRLLRMYTYY
jgi:Cu/Zn superoxide dismutase